MRKHFLCFVLILTIFSGGSPVIAEGNIRVKLDGAPIVFEVPPVIEAGRTLLPIRFAAQALGANVEWNQSGAVTIERGKDIVVLEVNNNRAVVNGAHVLLDVPVRLINGRTYVPLRFAAQALGVWISWNSNARTVQITTSGEDVPVPALQLVSSLGNDVITDTGQVLYLGMNADKIRALLGNPNRQEISEYGYDWWVYNSRPGRVVLIGVADNRMASIYVDDPNWQVAGVRKGFTQAELHAAYNLSNSVKFEYMGIRYTLELERDRFEEKPVAVAGENIVIFYRDNQKNFAVNAIRLFSKENFLLAQRYSKSWIGEANTAPPKLEGDLLARARRGQERIMMDLVNVFRVQNGVEPLTWLEKVAVVSRSHSRDMFENNFFAHSSPTTGSLMERVMRAGIGFQALGENLVKGSADAICGNHSLVNSPPHRENMLVISYNQIGIGYQDEIYTQKFIRLR